MKKLLIAAVGMTGLLAGCSVEIGTPVEPVSNLKLVEFTSQYVLANDAVDINTGERYFKNTPIICDNINTRLSVSVDFDGTINQFGAKLEGRDTTGSKTVYSLPLGNMYSGNPSVFEFVVGPNTAPLSVQREGVSAQGITVTPINTISVKGASYVTVQARSGDGTVSNSDRSGRALPIANCSS